jgi:hypothetical protein
LRLKVIIRSIFHPFSSLPWKRRNSGRRKRHCDLQHQSYSQLMTSQRQRSEFTLLTQQPAWLMVVGLLVSKSSLEWFDWTKWFVWFRWDGMWGSRLKGLLV